MNQSAKNDIDKAVDMYDDLLKVLTPLKEEYPEIKKKHEELEQSVSDLSSEITKQRKIIESQQHIIDQQQAIIAETEKVLAEQKAMAENQKKSAESYLKSIEALTKKASADIQKKREESLSAVEDVTEECLTKIHAKAKNVVTSFSYDLEIDFSEIDSIANLYEKYGQYMKTPMLVKGAGWDEDSCFAVKEIKDGKAYGDKFRDGKQEHNDLSYSANNLNYSIYNGPSLEIVQYLLSNR